MFKDRFDIYLIRENNSYNVGGNKSYIVGGVDVRFYEVLIYQLTFHPGLLFVLDAYWFI